MTSNTPPRVAYLHGMLGTAPEQPFLTELDKRGIRAVAPTLPGFSGTPPAEDWRGLIDWIGELSAIIDRLGLAGCRAVASSLGGMLALELAAIRPEAFTELILIAPLGLWDDEEPIADVVGATPRSQRDLLVKQPERLACFYEDTPGLDQEQAIEEKVARYVSRTTMAAMLWPIPEFGLKSRLHRIRCPVHLVWGEDDRVVPRSYAERLRAGLPRVAGLHLVPEAGHLAEWDQPEAVADIVAAVWSK